MKQSVELSAKSKVVEVFLPHFCSLPVFIFSVKKISKEFLTSA
ncbi:MAG: hypothetical protein UV09_C0002G0052 [Candidatus Gottesmanbacteria bacterium GW2011_GWA2_42_18]|uniref:Uncharacterized protein n=1 Tax=Candidatus Gottesmanbacteria bacterium GW2011_GWA2_42_18 TaxID=1618442 RepID=A0A0G0ZGQ8_9BACT|nr:MAG: hypothetical protein UV09_C0002G0052 [Candidatus Gottesmanbacteria bacterium GW2011_GWA2_42_18]